MFRIHLHRLQRNLAAGLRVALFRRVHRLDFRVSVGQLVLVAIVAMVGAGLVDIAVAKGAARFNLGGIAGQARDSAILVALCWLVAAALRAPGVALGLPLVFLAAGWLPDLVFAGVIAALGRALPDGARWLLTPLWWLFIGWSLAVAWRSVGIVLQGERRLGSLARVGAVAAVFGGMLAVAYLYPSARLWEQPTDDAALEAETANLPHVESEEVLAAQPRILYEALTGLEEREPGAQNTYFVGFAGDAKQDVFRNDMEAAQDVVDERLKTEGRSVVLINNPRTVLDTPLATMTNLRAALSTVGRLIDSDEDLVVVYLSSHGTSDHQLFVNFPPLELQQITPTALARVFQESGIKWKVVIVSSCYSGGYVEPLQDANTVVMTSARSDRTSFGCESGSDFTYFGQAFFQEALKTTDSLTGAFDLARAAIARREKAEGLAPSEPQIFVGNEIRKKLERRSKPMSVALR